MVDRLGKYEIIRTLGHGAMGEVYLAHHPVIGREVAIKTILPSAAKGEDAEGRFRREATAAGKLNHPNLVTIFDFDKDGDILYLVMEYVKGEDLEELVRERDLTHSQFLEVLAQVCDGLAFAHKAGIIHRDIKPANVRVTRDGKRLLAKVMDFGIARTEDSNLTSTGIVMGTVSYMAPEYIQTGKATTQADLWAVGVMLYECLAGRKPFHAENTTTVLFKIVSETPRALEPGEIHGISPSVRAVLERALAKDPGKRFLSAEQFGKALRACKDPNWTGETEQGLTTVVARQQAAEAAAEATSEATGLARSPSEPTALVAPAQPTLMAMPVAPAVDATTFIPAAAVAPAPPTVAVPAGPPVDLTVAMTAAPVPPVQPTVVPPAAPPTVAIPAGQPAPWQPPAPAPTPFQPARAAAPQAKGGNKTVLYAGIAAAVVVLAAGGYFAFGRKAPAELPPNPAAAAQENPAPATAVAPPPTAPNGVPAATPAKEEPKAATPLTVKTEAPKTSAPKTEPAKPAPQSAPPKAEPPPPSETPEQKLAKAMGLLGSDPRAAVQPLKALAYTEPTSRDPKVHGAYLAALYNSRGLAEFERAYDNAARGGFGAKTLCTASPEFKRLFNAELQALKDKREGVVTKEMTLKMFNDFTNNK
jgi:eukaryotic-like serine/threonine-protein kinase